MNIIGELYIDWRLIALPIIMPITLWGVEHFDINHWIGLGIFTAIATIIIFVPELIFSILNRKRKKGEK